MNIKEDVPFLNDQGSLLAHLDSYERKGYMYFSEINQDGVEVPERVSVPWEDGKRIYDIEELKFMATGLEISNEKNLARKALGYSLIVKDINEDIRLQRYSSSFENLEDKEFCMERYG